MLQKFQDEILNLTDIVHLEKLKKASKEIEKRLAKDNKRIIPFLLASIDPQIPISNSEIVEAKEIIAKSWTTFSGVAKDSPVTFIRAVIIHAIDELANDPIIANICVLATKNIIPFLKLTSGEESVIGGFIQRLSNETNSIANKTFAANYNGTLSSSATTNISLKRFKIEENALSISLEAASGPNDSDGTPIENANPNSPEEEGWSQEFAPKAAKAIGDAVNKVIAAQTSDLEQAIKGLNYSLLPDGNVDIVKLKTELLWWKFSSYSPSFDKSYRNLQSGVLELALAIDYANIVPYIFPKSVRFFLLDTHSALSSNPDAQINILEFIKILISFKSTISDKLQNSEMSSGRITLYDFIVQVIYGNLQIESFESKVGISSSQTMSYGDLCTWIFEDIRCGIMIKK